MPEPSPDLSSSRRCGFETFIKRNNNLAGPSRYILPHVSLSTADKQFNENLRGEAAPDLIHPVIERTFLKLKFHHIFLIRTDSDNIYHPPSQCKMDDDSTTCVWHCDERQLAWMAKGGKEIVECNHE